MTLRDSVQRKKDILDKLRHERDVWVATGDNQGKAHLVPLSLSWDGKNIIVATESRSVTVKNILKSHQARLAVGDTRDVILVDVSVEIIGVNEADKEISETFLSRNDWDPRASTGDWVYMVMSPLRIQAWQNEEELSGRTVMKDGNWLV